MLRATKREISSAGSEHLVYTEGVGGSNPSFPTKAFQEIERLFLLGAFPRVTIFFAYAHFEGFILLAKIAGIKKSIRNLKPCNAMSHYKLL